MTKMKFTSSCVVSIYIFMTPSLQHFNIDSSDSHGCSDKSLLSIELYFYISPVSVSDSSGAGEGDDQEEIHAILQRAHHTRKSAEHAAKQLLQRLDRSCGVQMVGCNASPWEELSSNSRTARWYHILLEGVNKYSWAHSNNFSLFSY